MNTAAPEQTIGEAPPGGRRRRRRWRWTAVVGTVALVAAVIAVIGRFDDPGSPGPGASDTEYPTSTATVARRSLVSETQVSATLGYAGGYTVVNQVRGTITTLPGVGRVVRQGQVLYRVDGRPVILLYGAVPAYRSLSWGIHGPDVAELNAALVALGHATRAQIDPDSKYFTLATADALERLQDRVGLPETGELALGQAVFLPAAARITGRGAGSMLGGPAQPGTALLTATSTTPVVTVNLDAAQQSEVKAGDKVTITLPTGRTTPGVVSSVGRVASKPSSDGTSTVTVQVTPTRPKAAGGLDRAPVQVSIVTGSVRDALVVPVTSLLAQAGGGYAVEVVGPKSNRLVAVSPGLFDSAHGLVQVTGPLSAGQRVVVPTS